MLSYIVIRLGSIGTDAAGNNTMSETYNTSRQTDGKVFTVTCNVIETLFLLGTGPLLLPDQGKGIPYSPTHSKCYHHL